MNCYSSFWELGENGKWEIQRPMNFWYKPLSPQRQREWAQVVRAARRAGLEFCFSLNPNLMSDRPFDYDSPRDPEAKLVFCPTWYAGTGDDGQETASRLGAGDTPGHRYTRAIAEVLDPAVYLFWTGPDVCSLRITGEDARKYQALVRHKLILWDNYPVNDQHPAIHLGPLTGRDAELATMVEGYIGNPLSFETEANRIPMLTIADCLADPKGYDPVRSIAWAVAELGRTPAGTAALKALVELYPGRLWDQSRSTGWNSVRERCRGSEAAKLRERLKAVDAALATAFPGRYTATRRRIAADLQ
jgi:hypothetical protein